MTNNISPAFNMESRQKQYSKLLKQIREVVYNEDDLVKNLTSIVALLHKGLSFSWTGFYFVQEEYLTLGPYLGPLVPSTISKKEGVCGSAYTKECVIIIDDIEQVPKYDPVGEFERSEIILPAFRKGEVALLLRANSFEVKNFTEIDQKYLQQVMHLIEEIL